MSPNRTPHRSHRTLRVESLERREVMSASPLIPDLGQPVLAFASTTVLAATASPGSVSNLAAATSTIGLDESFSGDGIAQDSRLDAAEDVVVQADGKIIAVGGAWASRFNADGSLDTTFGGGRVQLSIPATANLPASTGVQAKAVTTYNGSIYVAAQIGSSLAVLKLDSSGKLDSSFALNSFQRHNPDSINGQLHGWDVKDIAINSQGKVLVLAEKPENDVLWRPGSTNRTGFLVACFNGNGELNRDFGPAGDGWTGIGGGTAEALAVDLQGGIVAVGKMISNFTAVRYTSRGILDSSFGDKGIAQISSSAGMDVAIQSLNGQSIIAAVTEGFGLVRLNSSGSLIGSVQKVADGKGESIAIDRSSGKLVVAGSKSDQFVLARYHANATPDVEFDGDGIASVNAGTNEVVNALAISNAGRPLIAGSIRGSFAVVQFSDETITPPPSIATLDIKPIGVVEQGEQGQGIATKYVFRVTRSGNVSEATTFNWAVAGSGSHKADRSDFVGGNFASGTRTFAAGQTSLDIEIYVAGDSKLEADEQFTITLAKPSAKATLATASATGTIVNDDSGVMLNSLGQLIIQGGTNADAVSVDLIGTEVVVNFNGRQERFPVATVKALVFHGGKGDDSFTNNTPLAAQADGDEGNDRLLGGSGHDVLLGGAGNDQLEGRAGNDRLEGGVGIDKLFGGDGDDTLVAQDGTYGNDVVDGGAGSNTIVDDLPPPVPEVTLNRQGQLVIQGTSTADTASVRLVGSEVVVTFNGREKRFAASSVRSILFRGGNGNDTFTNNTSITSAAYGEQGDDTLIGGSGSDLLRGGAGKDWLEGRAANDALYGDVGNDTMQGGDGDDHLFGGDGDDHLDGSAGSDTLEGGQGNDGMYGGDGRDFLFGQEGNDWLYGGAGNDELDGDEDDDTLYGEEGNDRLVSRDGKAGNDKLYDWLGANVFDALMVEIELQAANKVVAKKR